MGEPQTVASRVEQVADGVWQWTIADERIGGGPSNTQAVEDTPGEIVVVNPVRLAEEELDKLGHVVAILLTGAGHVRSAAHYRELTGAAIWAPVGIDLEGVDPDETYTDGNELPGGLKAIAVAGPRGHEHAFLLERGRGVLIFGDAMLNAAEMGGLCVLPEKYNPDVSKTRESCRKLLDHDFELVLFGHGEPLRENARERLKEVLNG